MDKPNREILNRNVIISLIGDDKPLIRQFELEFLQQAKISMKKIAEYFGAQQFSEIKEEAHFLKTSAKAVGAEQTADLLENLEHTALDNDIQNCKLLIIQISNSIKHVYGIIANEN